MTPRVPTHDSPRLNQPPIQTAKTHEALSSSLQTAFGMALLGGISGLTATRTFGDSATGNAVAAAASLATFNGLSALALAGVGARQASTKGFFAAVFGGMVLRMAMTLAGFLAGVKLLLLPATSFAVALLVFSGLFTAAEIALWSRQNFSPRTQLS